MKRIRVGLVTYAMYGGGMETHLLRLGRYLVQQGLEAELVTTLEPGAWFDKAAEYGLPAKHISDYTSCKRFRAVSHAWRVGRWLRHGNYDALLLNHAMFANAALGMLPDDVFAASVFHNDSEAIYEVGCSNNRAWNVAVGVSPKVADEVRRQLPARPVTFIPYGVELPEEDAWNARREFGVPLRLIFVGRLDHRQKGVFFLPDILQGCRERGIDVHLTIIGDGPDGPKLVREFNAKGLNQSVQFMGMLPPEQIYSQLLAAHVMIMPSFFEGLPIALLESLACGCVLVVSDLPGITSYAVENHVTRRLVPVGDLAGFVRTIAEIAGDPEAWRRMSAAATAAVRQRFSVAAMGAAYLHLIERGLAGDYPLPISRRWQWPIDLRTLNRRRK